MSPLWQTHKYTVEALLDMNPVHCATTSKEFAGAAQDKLRL